MLLILVILPTSAAIEIERAKDYAKLAESKAGPTDPVRSYQIFSPETVPEALSTKYYISMSSDGSYVAAGVSDDKKVYLFRNGELLWTRSIDHWVRSISISSDGEYIAIGSIDGIYLFNRDGKLLWKYKGDYSFQWRVAISPDGNYIVANGRNFVYYFTKDGDLVWKRKIRGRSGPVAISSGGSYVVAVGGNIYFFNKDGELLWKSKKGGYAYKVHISSDGSYILASTLRSTYFFNKNGELLWEKDIPRSSISADGKYVVLADGYILYLLDRNGNILWSYRESSYDNFEHVAISSDGSRILASTFYTLYLFNKEGEFIRTYDVPKIGGMFSIGQISAMSISSDGECIVVTAYTGKIYFFGEVSTAKTTPTPFENYPFENYWMCTEPSFEDMQAIHADLWSRYYYFTYVFEELKRSDYLFYELDVVNRPEEDAILANNYKLLGDSVKLLKEAVEKNEVTYSNCYKPLGSSTEVFQFSKLLNYVEELESDINEIAERHAKLYKDGDVCYVHELLYDRAGEIEENYEAITATPECLRISLARPHNLWIYVNHRGSVG